MNSDKNFGQDNLQIDELKQQVSDLQAENRKLLEERDRGKHINRVLDAIRRINRLLTSEKNIDLLIDRVCQILTSSLGYHNAWIALLDESNSIAERTSSSGFKDDFSLLSNKLKRGEFTHCINRVLADEKMIVINDPAIDCPNCPLAKTYQGRAGLCTKLSYDNKILGVLSVSVPEKYGADKEEHRIFQELSDDISFALNKIETTQLLEASQKRYREIYEGSRDGFALIDVDGKIMDANKSFCELIGYNLEELKNNVTYLDITPEKWREWERIEIWENRIVKDGYSGLYEKEYIRKDGTIIQVELRAYGVHDDNGELSYVWGIVRNISESKRTQDELAQKLTHLRQGEAIAKLGYFERNWQTGEGFWSDGFYELLDLDRSSSAISHEKFLNFIHPDDLEDVTSHIQKSIINHETMNVKFRLVRKNGKHLQIHGIAENQYDEHDKPLITRGSFQDVTHVIESEEALLSQLKHVKGVAKASSSLLMERDFDENINEALEFLRETVDAGRIYIFENFNDENNDLFMRQTYESCSPDAKPEIDNPILQKYPYRNGYERWQKFLSGGNAIKGHVADFPESERHLLESQGIVSILVLPIFINGQWIGFMGFDHLETKRDWKEQEVVLLKTATDLVGGFMARNKAEVELNDKHQRLKFVFDGSKLGSWEYNVVQDSVVYNNHWAEMLGYTLEELQPLSYETWSSLTHTDDVVVAESRLNECLKGIRESFDCEIRMRHKNGSWVWIYSVGKVMRSDSDGNPLAIFGTHTDITQFKDVQEALAESQARYKSYVENAPYGIFISNENGKNIEVNSTACKITGYTEDELLKLHVADLIPEEFHDLADKHFKRLVTNGYTTGEIHFIRKSGEQGIWNVDAVKLAENRFLGFTNDISEKKENQERIETLSLMLDDAPAAISITDYDGKFLFINRRTIKMYGYDSVEEFLEINLKDLEAEDGLLDVETRLLEVKKYGEASFEVTHIRKDGSYLNLQVLGKKIEWDGRPAVLNLAADISEIVQTRKSLYESEERYRLLSDLTMEGILIHKNGVAIDLNNALADILKTPREELYNKDFLEFIHEDDLPLVMQNILKEYAEPYTIRIRRPNGEIFYAEIEAKDFNREDDVWRVSAVRDITKRLEAEEALRESEEKFRQIVERSSDIFYRQNINTGIVEYVSPNIEKIMGYTVQEFLLSSVEEQLKLFHPDDQGLYETFRPDLIEADESGQGFIEREFQLLRKNGEYAWIHGSYTLIRDEANEPYLIVGGLSDITDHKTAEEEHSKLQEQLHQAQKMESVGRLAGGVAHDFNNMLGVILGNVEIALMEVAADHPLYEELNEIQKVTLRSAELTRQLLGFARKQTVLPKVLDLNEVIDSQIKMLRRLIGENIDLIWEPSDINWKVRIDPSQVDQILTNLIVNSRDAIKDVGRIEIETETVSLDNDDVAEIYEMRSGDYMQLSVKDNGSGMDEDIVPHIFDPFYTTKSRGKGTGLGLSTVYGIVKQNKGHITISSEVDQGTMFIIYLPRHEKIETIKTEEKGDYTVQGGNETILLVEDESAILKIEQRILSNMGYEVLAANTPSIALEKAKAFQGHIHLLITDVMMPEMNGRDLSELVLKEHPEMKCLFMSGYSEDVIAKNGVIPDNILFIQKPFTTKVLAEKVRKVLA